MSSRRAVSIRRWSRTSERMAGNNIGRIYTCVFGTATVVATFFFVGHTTFATTALVAGSVLVAIGAMAPWLRSVKWPGGSVDMQAPALQRAKVAKEMSDDLALDDASVSRPETLDATRYLVATLATKGIIEEAKAAYPGFGDCEFRFFMFDDDKEKLFAVLRTGQSEGEGRGWRRGEGVTGSAYDTGEYQIATGSATHDGSHNLDEDRQRRYAELTEVAAMPVLNAAGATIGVEDGSGPDGSPPAGAFRQFAEISPVAGPLVALSDIVSPIGVMSALNRRGALMARIAASTRPAGGNATSRPRRAGTTNDGKRVEDRGAAPQVG